MNRGFGFAEILRNDNALAERQSVRLDDRGIAVSLGDVSKCRLRVVEHLIRRAGNAEPLHQILGKHLAALDDGGSPVGAEGADALRLKRVHHAENQRIVGRDEYAVHIELLCERHHSVDVVRGDVKNLRVL